MDDTPLVAGKNYYLKLGTKQIPAVVMNISHKIDVNTGNEIPADTTYKNEIAQCDISVSDKIVYEKFKNNQALGSLILIDRVTNMTSACGIVLHSLRRSDNLTWQKLDVTREFRAKSKGTGACNDLDDRSVRFRQVHRRKRAGEASRFSWQTHNDA